jgi:hypothetical protein
MGIDLPNSSAAAASRSLALGKHKGRAVALRKFIIERDIPEVGSFEREQLRGAARSPTACCASSGPTSNGSKATWRRTRRFAFILPGMRISLSNMAK